MKKRIKYLRYANYILQFFFVRLIIRYEGEMDLRKPVYYVTGFIAPLTKWEYTYIFKTFNKKIK